MLHIKKKIKWQVSVKTGYGYSLYIMCVWNENEVCIESWFCPQDILVVYVSLPKSESIWNLQHLWNSVHTFPVGGTKPVYCQTSYLVFYIKWDFIVFFHTVVFYFLLISVINGYIPMTKLHWLCHLLRKETIVSIYKCRNIWEQNKTKKSYLVR